MFPEDIPCRRSAADLIRWGESRLSEASSDRPRLEAQILLAHTLEVSRDHVLAGLITDVTDEQARGYCRLVLRRASGTPFAYVLGYQDFYGLRFTVTPATLVPRPETELLVDVALERLNGMDEPMLIDVCSGSGCAAIAVAYNAPSLRVLSMDISPEATEVARHNGAAHGVEDRVCVICADLLTPVAACSVDIVIANPPYIRSSEIPDLQTEVRDWEPRIAVDGGPDGMLIHRRLLPQAYMVLRSGGLFALEVAAGQAADAARALRDSGFAAIRSRADLAGHERVVMGIRP